MERKKKTNIILTATGFVFFLLGIAGLMIPVVPQVPFLLAVLGCFARGCPAVHRRICSTKLYTRHIAPYIRSKKRLTVLKKLLALSLSVTG